MLSAEDPAIAGALLLLSYPLHPPRQHEKPRTDHFPALRTPALFVHGTRDPFGTIAEMEAALRLIPAKTTLLPVEGAAHGLPPPIAASLPGRFQRSWNDEMMLGERLGRVEERIRCAADRAGPQARRHHADRGHQEVSGRGDARGLRARPARVRRKLRAGVRDANIRRSPISPAREFHLIGHLQSNKARIAGGTVSGDRDRRFRKAGPPSGRGWTSLSK